MKKCDENTARVLAENVEKDLEIERKIRIRDIMIQKAKRIEKQRGAVQQYQVYLEDVRAKNSDLYSSISAIMDRHSTL